MSKGQFGLGVLGAILLAAAVSWATPPTPAFLVCGTVPTCGGECPQGTACVPYSRVAMGGDGGGAGDMEDCVCAFPTATTPALSGLGSAAVIAVLLGIVGFRIRRASAR